MSSKEEELAYQQEKWKELKAREAENHDELIEAEFALLQAQNMGHECKVFWESKVGRFIMNRAAEHSEAAKNKMVGIKRSEFKTTDEFIAKVEDLQQQAHIPTLMWNWMNEAIRAAKEAESILNQEVYDD